MLHPEWIDVFTMQYGKDLDVKENCTTVLDIVKDIKTDLRRLVGYDIGIHLGLEKKYDLTN